VVTYLSSIVIVAAREVGRVGDLPALSSLVLGLFWLLAGQAGYAGCGGCGTEAESHTTIVLPQERIHAVRGAGGWLLIVALVSSWEELSEVRIWIWLGW